MLNRITVIHSIYRIFFRMFRKRRMRAFAETFRPAPAMTILDVGGSSYNWDIIHCPARVTMLNLTVPDDTSGYPSNYSFVEGDGTRLSYEDGSFDVAYSNSVIEHLYNYENQKKFAAEIRRVGKGLWVQTPARSFFIEPHLVAPFIHYLPRRWQRRLLRNFTVWGLITRPNQQQVDDFLDEVKLLDYRQMRELFPDCTILREKVLFFTKSYIAVRPFARDTVFRRQSPRELSLSP